MVDPGSVLVRRPIVIGYAVALTCGCLLQLALGCDSQIVLLVLFSILVSALPAFVFGARDMPALLSFAVGARYASSAVIWKLSQWQPMDQGLYDAHTSFVVIAWATAAIAAAALASHLLFPRGPLFHEKYAAPGLEILCAIGGVAVGFGLLTVYRKLDELGGIMALAGAATTLFPVALMALNLARGRPAISKGVIGAVFLLCIASLGVNSRQALLQPLAAVVGFLVCFKVPVSRKLLISGLATAAVFVLVISPLMLAVRGARNLLTPSQMVNLTATALRSGDALRNVEMARRMIVNDGPYAMHYTSGSNEIVQRMVNVEQMDIMVDRARRFGALGTARFWRGVVEFLPSAIVPDKTVSKSPSYAFWVYGMIPWGIEFNPTPTTFGDAYSIGGLDFVIESSFVVYLLWFAFFRACCPRFENSLLATFLIVAYGFTLTAQNVLGVVGVMVREVPIEIAIFILATQIRRPVFALMAPAARSA